jgi:hypothetical protein
MRLFLYFIRYKSRQCMSKHEKGQIFNLCMREFTACAAAVS